MKETFAGRLDFLISNLGIKQLDFARRINFTQSYVSMVLSGIKTSPSARFLDAICREFNVNAEWLKDGNGDVYAIPDQSLPADDAELLAKYRLLPKSDQKIVEEIVNAFLLKTMTADNSKPSKQKDNE
jgi:transcriptional regulator with XRE-family HTH domain